MKETKLFGINDYNKLKEVHNDIFGDNSTLNAEQLRYYNVLSAYLDYNLLEYFSDDEKEYIQIMLTHLIQFLWYHVERTQFDTSSISVFVLNRFSLLDKSLEQYVTDNIIDIYNALNVYIKMPKEENDFCIWK